MASGTTGDLNGVWGSSSSDVFAVGDYGTILHYPESSSTAPSGTQSPIPAIISTTPTRTQTPTPAMASITPTEGNQGNSLDVTITGTDFAGATDVIFGEGITVNAFNVDDSTQITVNITIAKDATVGARDVSVTTAGGTGTLSQGFTVKGKKGGGFTCGTISEPTPPSELLIGWGIILSCAVVAYWAATRVGKRQAPSSTESNVTPPP